MLDDGPEANAWLGLMEKRGAIGELVAFFYDSLSSMMGWVEEFFGLQQGVYESCEVHASKMIFQITSGVTGCLSSSCRRCRRVSSFPGRSRILSGSGRGLPYWRPPTPSTWAIDSCLPCSPTLHRTLEW